MGIISWIILGLIAGFIGSKIVDSQGQGFWLNIALGVIGALLSVQLVRRDRRHRPEHLEHHCCGRRRDRRSTGLQCPDGSPQRMKNTD